MDKPDLNFLTAEDAENAEGNYALVNSMSWSISFHSEFSRSPEESSLFKINPKKNRSENSNNKMNVNCLSEAHLLNRKWFSISEKHCDVI